MRLSISAKLVKLTSLSSLNAYWGHICISRQWFSIHPLEDLRCLNLLEKFRGILNTKVKNVKFQTPRLFCRKVIFFLVGTLANYSNDNVNTVFGFGFHTLGPNWCNSASDPLINYIINRKLTPTGNLWWAGSTPTGQRRSLKSSPSLQCLWNEPQVKVCSRSDTGV